MAAPKPIQTSDIIFPVLSTDFSSTLSSLKRSTLAVSNRLRSIAADAAFVCAVAEAYGLPLVANERCGSWYIPLDRKAASAYFKSTDGHMGEWAFSLRRLNTQVLDLVAETNGCIIVDSTRRGKRMPDALSKTVPIWCAVWNRLLFPNNQSAAQLHTPPQSVSASEHSQMQSRIQGFAQQARQLNVDLDSLRKKITKPLRPLWVTQDSALPAEPPEYSDFLPILLCTASRRVPGGEASEGGYIQGAGDDSEGWAHGLSAQLFWENQEELLHADEADQPELIAKLVSQASKSGHESESILIKPTTSLYVAPLVQLSKQDGTDSSVIIACSAQPDIGLQREWKSRYLHLSCGTGKLGSRDLRNEIQKIEPFLQNVSGEVGRILVGCQTGKDISVGVALAVLCLYIDDSGSYHAEPNEKINKAFIRQRLSWIMTSFPAASPSRATLQSVNAFLFSARPNGPPPPTTPPAGSPEGPGLSPDSVIQHARPPSRPLRSIFDSLTDTWSLHRTLTSALPSQPSGVVVGTADFRSRPSTSSLHALEFLYLEQGTFKTDNGLEMSARRRYVWRFRDASSARPEGISVWFAGEDGESADGLFVEMGFRDPVRSEGKVVAEGRHWCEPDDYKAEFEFGEEGMTVTYVVRGPRKDYVSKTLYRR